MWSRQQLEDARLVVSFYVGIAVTIALFIALILGHSVVIPGFVPAAGLMLYKTVRDAATKEEE